MKEPTLLQQALLAGISLLKSRANETVTDSELRHLLDNSADAMQGALDALHCYDELCCALYETKLSINYRHETPAQALARNLMISQISRGYPNASFSASAPLTYVQLVAPNGCVITEHQIRQGNSNNPISVIGQAIMRGRYI